MTLLHAAKHGLLGCVEMILKSGAQPNLNNFVEPLQNAAVVGHIKCVRVLLQNGAPVNTCARNNNRCLVFHCVNAPTLRQSTSSKKTLRET